MKQLLSLLAVEADPLATEKIEPGLLPAFRILLGLQLQFMLVGSVAVSLLRQELPPLPIRISLVVVALLLFYLWWSPFQRQLGRAFLPIALATAILLPIAQRLLFIHHWLAHNQQPLTEDLLNGNGYRGAVILLIPMVFVAWQYGFQRLLAVSGVVALLDWLALRWFLGGDPALAWPILGIALGEGITFIVIGYLVTLMLDAQRQQRAELAAANQRLSHYASTLEQLTVSRERNRLARELHDTLAHTLSAVSIQLEAVDSAWESNPDQARLLLSKSLAQTRSGLTETRRALQALRASPLEDLGLGLALRNLAESTARRGSLQLQVQIDAEINRLTPDVEQNLYRVAQEALANVLKHAGASELQVALAVERRQIVLTIRDNGNGFDSAIGNGNGHYGLRGMQERAEMIGGALAVQSKPGAGTTVRLTVGKP